MTSKPRSSRWSDRKRRSTTIGGRTLSDVPGREITYERPSHWRYIRRMHTDTAFDLGVILFSCLLYTLVRLGRSERTTDHVEAVLTRPPRSLRDVAEDYAEVWT